MVEPNIIKTKYYTLVSADTGHGKTLWCKKKVARLLRTTQDRIIVIDVTGEYADFVLDHDRIVPGRIPMVMHQYKLSGGWPVDAHIIEVDMPINRQPQLIVYDVSRTMGTWHRGVLAISDALLGYITGRENTTTWLFLMPAPQEVKEPAMNDTTEHEPISPIVTAMVNDSVSNETLDDIANVMNGVVKEPETEQNEEPEQGYISEQCDKPVEEVLAQTTGITI